MDDSFKAEAKQILLLWSFLSCVITVILVDFLVSQLGRDAFVQDKVYQWVSDV